MDLSTPILVNALFGISVSIIIGISYSNYKRNKIPQRWKKVGKISDLYFFPIKSCGRLKGINQVQCSAIGVQHQFLQDRTFMVMKENEKRFVTARQYPEMVQIGSSIQNDKMIISAPNMDNIEIDIRKILAKNEIMYPEMWDNARVKVYDCGDNIADWLSEFISKKHEKLRLVFYPFSVPTRAVRPVNSIFSESSPDHVGALHDATSFMLINENSIKELNSRLDSKVDALYFRPNFVLDGPIAFDEDNYKWIKIGDDTIMKVIQPCTRCSFTNIDPHLGKRRKDGEPLKTLKEYRKFPKIGESPVMGIHLGMINQGTVKIGDPVFVQAD